MIAERMRVSSRRRRSLFQPTTSNERYGMTSIIFNQRPPTKGKAWSPLFSTNDLQRKVQHDLHFFQPKTSNKRYSMTSIIFNQRPPTKGTAWPPCISTKDLQRKVQHDLHYFQPTTSNERYSMTSILFNKRPPKKGTAWPPFFSTNDLQRKGQHDLHSFQPTTSNESCGMTSIIFNQRPPTNGTVGPKSFFDQHFPLRCTVLPRLTTFAENSMTSILFRPATFSKRYCTISTLFSTNDLHSKVQWKGTLWPPSWVNCGSPVKGVT